MADPIVEGSIVNFHGADGVDHRARIVKLYPGEVADIQLINAGPQKRNDELAKIARGDHETPFRWHP